MNLRLLALPYHKLLLNAARASGDRSAFGAYLTREWGAYKCYGQSMESGVLDPEPLRNYLAELSVASERRFCDMTPTDWRAMQSGVLKSEGLPWANAQAYAVEDLRNWMHYGPGITPARSVALKAAAITPAQACGWFKSGDQPYGVPVKVIAVEVPLAH